MIDAGDGEETGEGGSPGRGGAPGTGGRLVGTGGMPAGTGGMPAGMGGMPAGMGGMPAGMGGMRPPDAGMGGSMGMGGMMMGMGGNRPDMGGMGGAMNMAAMLTITPTTKDFTMTMVGMESATQDFTVRNTGTAAVTVTSALGGANLADFALGTNDCNKSLLPNATCTVQVKFKPTTGGAKAGTITVAGGAVMAQATLTGMAMAAPSALTITPAMHDFGTVELMASAAPQTFTIRNTGAAGTGMLTLMVAGTSALVIPVATNTCTTLAAAATCTVVVTFSPTTLGAKVGTLTVTPIMGSPATAALTGNAVAVGQGTNKLTLDAATKDAGDSPIGVKKDVTFTVTNTGTVASGTPAFTVTGTNMAEFVVGANTCGAAIAPAATCTVTVGFNPTAVGPRTASLKVAATPGGEVTGALTGNGTAAATLTITPISRDFGIVEDNAAVNTDMDFVVKNNGTVATSAAIVSVTAGDPPFSRIAAAGAVDCNGLALGANASCTIRVRMNHGGVGIKTGTLTFVATTGGTLTAPLTGRVVAAGSIVAGVRYRYFEIDAGALAAIPNFATGLKTDSYTTSFLLDGTTTLRNDNIAMEYTALLKVNVAGSYIFSTNSDDGSRLSINGVEIVNNDNVHGPTLVASAAVDLAVGLTPIKVTYFNGPAGAGGTPNARSLDVRYSAVAAGVNDQTIPAAVLFRPLDVPGPVIPPNLISGSLNYKYYEAAVATTWATLPDFGALTPIKENSVVGFDISVANRAEQFGLQFTGFVTTPGSHPAGTNQTYTFSANSDDGVRLYIDGQLIVDDPVAHGVRATAPSGTISLAAGPHAIRVDYFQGAGLLAADKVLDVKWSGPGFTGVAIDNALLSRPPLTGTVLPAASVTAADLDQGLHYKYFEQTSALPNIPADFNTQTPLAVGTSAGFDVNASARPAGRNDFYAFQWNGYVLAGAQGEYTFFTNSDDGSALYIDGVKVVTDNDGNHGTQERSGVVTLAMGYHTIRVDYYQGNGGADLDVLWLGPAAVTGITKVVIPATVLFRPKATPSVPVGATTQGLTYSYWSGGVIASMADFPTTAGTAGMTTNGFDISSRVGDSFAFEFKGYLDVTQPGSYTFSTSSDDGSRLWVDGQQVVDNDGSGRTTAVNSPAGPAISLAAGKHQIRLRYYHAGTETPSVAVGYTGPDQSSGGNIPLARLVRAQ